MCQNGVGSQRYVSKVVVVLMISASWLWTQMLIVVAMLVVMVAMVAMVVCPVSSVQVAAVAGTRPHIPHSRQGSSVPQHQTSLAGNMECVSTPGTCWSWTFDIVRCSESRGQSAGVTGDLWSIGSEEREREKVPGVRRAWGSPVSTPASHLTCCLSVYLHHWLTPDL